MQRYAFCATRPTAARHDVPGAPMPLVGIEELYFFISTVTANILFRPWPHAARRRWRPEAARQEESDLEVGEALVMASRSAEENVSISLRSWLKRPRHAAGRSRAPDRRKGIGT